MFWPKPPHFCTAQPWCEHLCNVSLCRCRAKCPFCISGTTHRAPRDRRPLRQVPHQLDRHLVSRCPQSEHPLSQSAPLSRQSCYHGLRYLATEALPHEACLAKHQIPAAAAAAPSHGPCTRVRKPRRKKVELRVAVFFPPSASPPTREKRWEKRWEQLWRELRPEPTQRSRLLPTPIRSRTRGVRCSLHPRALDPRRPGARWR